MNIHAPASRTPGMPHDVLAGLVAGVGNDPKAVVRQVEDRVRRAAEKAGGCGMGSWNT
ncbi:hypothetical protein ACGFYV_03850 [Streptomyces sp. NPDC048297]|uniref:hypothetical protein n=1 Tax=Streptomyces sp. NPDC048297 TaxID=3365531 RepID=UPI0037124CAC